MQLVRQIASATGMNLRSLPQRASTSLVIVIGIAGVVGVLISVLAMSTGMLQAMDRAGREDRAIVLRTGSTTESVSALSRESVRSILDAPGIKRSAEAKPIASVEGMRMVNLSRKKDGADIGVAFRGVSSEMWSLRPELKIIEGRSFRPAVNEIIVGKALQSQFDGVQIGDRVETKSATWTVVGVFSADGGFHESELIGDIEVMHSMDGRGYQSVTVMLESADAFEGFKDALTSNPALAVDVEREREFFARRSERTSKVIKMFAFVVGGVMAVGAIFSAVNTMYSAVSTRVREIATLRAIGFGATAIVVSVLVEALLLSLLGAAAGTTLAVLVFNGHQVSTSAGSQGTHHLVFELSVTWELIVVGVLWSCAVGLIGGLLPALRAARLPVAKALAAV